MTSPLITVITATYRRPKDLWRLFECLQLVDLTEMAVEHLVIHDGPNEKRLQAITKAFPQHPGIDRKYLCLEKHHGQFGAFCKDFGLITARGKYVVFWDDDNWFYPHALMHLIEIVGIEKRIGVCQLRHHAFRYEPIPNAEIWEQANRTFSFKNIDTGCFIIETELARQGFWYDQQGPGSDHRYFKRVIQAAGGYDTLVFDQTIIGVHL
ncbi:glycosyltransferase family 2 protein [Rubinisphaera italica]|uniref:Putative glycosyl transferase n=1 Tax=Rubinisphaera italica TaxID=2527969 RepID=A0A5C5XH18_9PLAN|nr:glycosyltransferase [Rubinisphaera italica]TWT61711.1 putative glycosyl transferase [Rubinisphaera italica]